MQRYIHRIGHTKTSKRIDNNGDAHAAVRQSAILDAYNDAMLQIPTVVYTLHVVFRPVPGTEPPHRITHEDNALTS